MQNEKISGVLKEAFATAPTNVIFFETLEFNHPTFKDKVGQPTPIRVVNNHADLTATLERTRTSSGEAIPGVEATFTRFSFVLKLPKISEGTGAVLRIELDNVTEILSQQLDKTKGSNDSVEVIYRPYLSSDLSAPQIDPPYKLVLRSVKVDAFKITAIAGFPIDFTNKSFPSEVYDRDRFPGLAT